MKKLTLVLGLLLFTFSFAFSQASLTKVKIIKYSGTSVLATYQERTYTNSQVDSTEWLSWGDCDSVQFMFVSDDSASAHTDLVYGDGTLCKRITAAHLDSIGSGVATGTQKVISWASIVAATGGGAYGGRLVLSFNAYQNFGTTQKYSVYLRRFFRTR